MSTPFRRDADGYVDINAFSDDPVDVDLAAMAPVPPVPAETWDMVVAAAAHTDPDALGIDVDTLVGPAVGAEHVAAVAAAAPWREDADIEIASAGDDITAVEAVASDHEAGGFEGDESPFDGD